MSGNTIGKLFTVTSFGESHGTAIGCIIDGSPTITAEPLGSTGCMALIIGGAPVKGPADRLLRAVGVEVSARGVAGLYRDLCGGYVLDEREAPQAADVEAMGMGTAVVDTLMRDVEVSQKLYAFLLERYREAEILGPLAGAQRRPRGASRA